MLSIGFSLDTEYMLNLDMVNVYIDINIDFTVLFINRFIVDLNLLQEAMT